jgi:hypothetical protein
MDNYLRLILAALREAQAVVAVHLEPEGPDAVRTLSTLLGILDDKQLLAAQRAIEEPGSGGDMRDDPPPQRR